MNEQYKQRADAWGVELKQLANQNNRDAFNARFSECLTTLCDDDIETVTRTLHHILTNYEFGFTPDHHELQPSFDRFFERHGQYIAAVTWRGDNRAAAIDLFKNKDFTIDDIKSWMNYKD